MFYLYLKTHNKTGLKYLGYTKNIPSKYKGSGLYWKRHLKEHGNNVTTEILFESENIDDISAMGQYYSNLWNIVDNNEYANLCMEDGNKIYGKANINFRGHPQSEETRKKISRNNGLGNKGRYGIQHPAYGHKVHPDNVSHLEYARSKKGPAWNKGKILPTLTKSTKEKMKNSANRSPKEKVICPHCKKEGGRPAMLRFHFNNCRSK